MCRDRDLVALLYLYSVVFLAQGRDDIFGSKNGYSRR